MRVYMLKRYKERKNKAIEFLGGKCKKCSSSEKLEFDHIDRSTKSFTIAKLWSLSEKTFWTEINKCQLLCQDCHNLKTIEESGRKVAKGTHGTLSSYRYCKCPSCRKAKSEWQKNYERLKKMDA